MTPLISTLTTILLLVNLATFGTAASASPKSNRTLANLSFYSKDDPSEMKSPKGPCYSDEECTEALQHEAYCVERHCACPVSYVFVRRDGIPQCILWTCDSTDECTFADSDLVTNEVCLRFTETSGICKCNDGWHADKWRCVEDDDDCDDCDCDDDDCDDDKKKKKDKKSKKDKN